MSEPTMKEVLKLVSFKRVSYDKLVVQNVSGSISGSVGGDIGGDVVGNVFGSVGGYVAGNVFDRVFGNVCGTINGRDWQFVETTKEKAIRLIEEGRGEEAIQVLQESDDD